MTEPAPRDRAARPTADPAHRAHRLPRRRQDHAAQPAAARIPALADTAVIINEFGEIGLDHLLVSTIDDDMVLLQSGCLCCTLRGDLVDALEKLLRDLDNGRATFRRVVIETTGLADPAPVLQTAMAHPYLVMRFRLDGVVTVVDAVNGAPRSTQHLEVGEAGRGRRPAGADQDRPARYAGARAPPRTRCVARLRALNPAAPILDAAAARRRRRAARLRPLRSRHARSPTSSAGSPRRPMRRSAHDHHHHHHHDRNRHDDRIRAFSLATDAADPGGDASTCSSISALDARTESAAPQGHREDRRDAGPAAGDPRRPARVASAGAARALAGRRPAHPLVFITRDIEPRVVRELFDAFLGAAAPDRPDRAALARQSAGAVRRRRPLTPLLATPGRRLARMPVLAPMLTRLVDVERACSADGKRHGIDRAARRLTSPSSRGALRALQDDDAIAKNPTRVFPDVIDELADKYGDAPALLSDRERFSYRELAERSNRYARWALAQGIGKGDTVCLLMPNRPEFMAIWLGVTRVGGVVALLNTNLTGPSLAHCINIVAAASTSSWRPSCSSRSQTARAAAQRATPRSGCTARPTPSFRASTARSTACPASALAAPSGRPLTIEDRALYIYTSGTTGLPKAANINHYRVMLASHGFAGVMDTTRDRPHVRLPADVSHRRRRAARPARCWSTAARSCMREKFSAREFWDDIVRCDCTLFQYIGELCRYLVNSPPHPNETRAPAAARLRQRPAARRLGASSSALPDPADPRVLRRDRRQRARCSISRARPARSAACPGSSRTASRPRSCASTSRREQPVRNARGLLHRVRRRRDRRGDRQDLNDPSKPGSRFEGYATRGRDREEDPARRVREGRRLVPHRRPDAQGRATAISTSSTASATPSAGRARTSRPPRSPRRSATFPGIAGGQRLRRQRAGPRRPRRHGGDRRPRAISTSTALRDHLDEQLPDYARPVFLRIRKRDRRHRHLQAEEDRSGEARASIRAAIADPIYFNDPQRKAFVRARRRRCTSGSVPAQVRL